MRMSWREGVLALVSLALLGAVMAADRIPQPLAYHEFADRRALFGVPNFFNVASNALFLLAGLAGMALCSAQRAKLAISWTVLFAGTALVAVGSAYYHWRPDNASLVWDRLPMTVALMGLLVALVSEHLDARVERVMLIPAVLIGAGSVAWWHYTDDLRLYVWVQALPLVAIALVIALYPGRYSHRRFLLYGLGCYVVAKAAEFWDREIFALTAGALSGHSLKHLLAGIALMFVYFMLRWRNRLPAPQALASAPEAVERNTHAAS